MKEGCEFPWPNQLDLGHVELFLDSILVVRVLFELFDPSRDISILLSDDYRDIVELVEAGLFLKFVIRNANIVTHNSARFGARCFEICTWTIDCLL